MLSCGCEKYRIYDLDATLCRKHRTKLLALCVLSLMVAALIVALREGLLLIFGLYVRWIDWRTRLGK